MHQEKKEFQFSVLGILAAVVALVVVFFLALLYIFDRSPWTAVSASRVPIDSTAMWTKLHWADNDTARTFTPIQSKDTSMALLPKDTSMPLLPYASSEEGSGYVEDLMDKSYKKMELSTIRLGRIIRERIDYDNRIIDKLIRDNMMLRHRINQLEGKAFDPNGSANIPEGNDLVLDGGAFYFNGHKVLTDKNIQTPPSTWTYDSSGVLPGVRLITDTSCGTFLTDTILSKHKK